MAQNVVFLKIKLFTGRNGGIRLWRKGLARFSGIPGDSFSGSVERAAPLSIPHENLFRRFWLTERKGAEFFYCRRR